MKSESKQGFKHIPYSLSEKRITAENVKRTGELLTGYTFRTVRRYSATVLDDLYYGFIRDVTRSGAANYVFSDGYDIAQEVICFLCGHIGKTLGEASGIIKNGKNVSILIAAFRIASKQMVQKRTNLFRAVDIDGLEPELTATPLDLDTEGLTDYTAVDATIERMGLTDKQKEALSYRMSGKSLNETARLLSLTIQSIMARMEQVRKKYIKHFA